MLVHVFVKKHATDVIDHSLESYLVVHYENVKMAPSETPLFG